MKGTEKKGGRRERDERVIKGVEREESERDRERGREKRKRRESD